MDTQTTPYAEYGYTFVDMFKLYSSSKGVGSLDVPIPRVLEPENESCHH